VSFLLSIIPTLLVLGILILIHELGHFIACRLTKVRVEKFSIGFGPEIFHWQGKETRYVISLFPLGGFVKPAGETVGEGGEAALKPGDFLAASFFSRFFIVVAGVLMNYLLAFALFIFIFLVGRPVPGTTVGGFVEGYPAEASGLQTGDRIVRVNEQPVNTWMEMTDILQSTQEERLELGIERPSEGGEVTEISIQVTPKVEEVKDLFGQSFQMRRLGITPHPEAHEFERYGLATSIGKAWDTTLFMTGTTYKAIYYLILGKLSLKTMAGPIGIISLTGSAAKLGLPYLLQLTATLSISLAVINLLPIPALDGGHLLFLVIEGIRRKRLSLELQERLTQVGFVLLMILMVFVLYNDLANLQTFEKIREFLQTKNP
jgi:regulator of sigma E protease